MTAPLSSEKDALVPAWEPATLIQRLRECRFMLYQHGCLTDSEKDRVDGRIEKKFGPKEPVSFSPNFDERHGIK